MTDITANHTGCGDVALTEKDIKVFAINPEDDFEGSFYSFDCPGVTVGEGENKIHRACGQWVVKVADRRIMRALHNTGVEMIAQTLAPKAEQIVYEGVQEYLRLLNKHDLCLEDTGIST